MFLPSLAVIREHQTRGALAVLVPAAVLFSLTSRRPCDGALARPAVSESHVPLVRSVHHRLLRSIRGIGFSAPSGASVRDSPRPRLQRGAGLCFGGRHTERAETQGIPRTVWRRMAPQCISSCRAVTCSLKGQPPRRAARDRRVAGLPERTVKNTVLARQTPLTPRGGRSRAALAQERTPHVGRQGRPAGDR